MTKRYFLTHLSCLFFLGVFFLPVNDLYAQADTSMEKPPTFEGGRSKLADFVNEYMLYPPNAFYDGIAGVVVINFTVDKDGMMKNFAVSRHAAPALDSEALRVIRLMSQVMHKWNPGKHEGKQTAMTDSFEVAFDIHAYEQLHNVDHLDKSPDPGFVVPKFIKDNLKYPALAAQNHVEGRVLIKFVINEDGTVGDVHVARSVGSGCDEEAVNIIKKMPRWSPGLEHGKPIKTELTLPVQFSLH